MKGIWKYFFLWWYGFHFFPIMSCLSVSIISSLRFYLEPIIWNLCLRERAIRIKNWMKFSLTKKIVICNTFLERQERRFATQFSKYWIRKMILLMLIFLLSLYLINTWNYNFENRKINLKRNTVLLSIQLYRNIKLAKDSYFIGSNKKFFISCYHNVLVYVLMHWHVVSNKCIFIN